MASKERIKRSLSCPLVEDQDSYSFDQEPVEDVEQNIIAGRTREASAVFSDIRKDYNL